MTHQESILAYNAAVHTDYDTGIINGINDPWAYATSHKVNGPDNPSFNEAMFGKELDKYIEALQKEIAQLVKQKTWEVIPHSKVPLSPNGKQCRVLKATWAFKLKQLPDGSPSKYKAQYCVQGDLQMPGVDFFETYAPVVQWSTVQMVLTMVLLH